jgi:hypothetical protein
LLGIVKIFHKYQAETHPRKYPKPINKQMISTNQKPNEEKEDSCKKKNRKGVAQINTTVNVHSTTQIIPIHFVVGKPHCIHPRGVETKNKQYSENTSRTGNEISQIKRFVVIILAKNNNPTLRADDTCKLYMMRSHCMDAEWPNMPNVTTRTILVTNCIKTARESGRDKQSRVWHIEHNKKERETGDFTFTTA